MRSRSSTKEWTFAPRFRARAFGPRSSKLACQRVREAVSEIKGAARTDPVRAGEGDVLLFERLWPALEQVDSSSGALGTATHHAVRELTEVLIAAPADDATLDRWLERLWQAILDSTMASSTSTRSRNAGARRAGHASARADGLTGSCPR